MPKTVWHSVLYFSRLQDSSPLLHRNAIAKIKSSEVKKGDMVSEEGGFSQILLCLHLSVTYWIIPIWWTHPKQTWSGSELEANGARVSTKHIPRGNWKSSSKNLLVQIKKEWWLWWGYSWNQLKHFLCYLNLIFSLPLLHTKRSTESH